MDSAFLVARPVIYTDDIPSVLDAHKHASFMLERLLNPSNTRWQDLFTELEYIKKTCWRDEHEFRIVSAAFAGDDIKHGDNGEYVDRGFFSQDLKAVYFGYKCTKENKEITMKMLSYDFNHVKAFETKIDGVQSKLIFSQYIPVS